MKILSMTATFGKLNHDTLTLKPGMNIIESPNEWGKSTWCAFLVAMLYGIDTRQQTTKDALADKEHYRPWSGAPMSGRMELDWNGRLITIERSTKGRIPMGEFRAFETESGLPVPELTAANCGLQLLGVERNVFTRAGFIRLQDMPVTQDEALRRRLNNLVTTGDESGAGDRLGKQLRELKNKCRYNRSGLLPQAENEREQLRTQLQRLEQLQQELQQMRIRQTQLDRKLKLLSNHETALRHAAALQGAQRVEQAIQNQEQVRQELADLKSQCEALPDQQTVSQKLQEGQQLTLQRKNLQERISRIPQSPVSPQVPAHYAGMTPEDAVAEAKADQEENRRLERSKKKQAKVPVFYGIAAAVMVIALLLCKIILHIDTPLLFICGSAAVVLGGIATLVLCAAAAKKRAAAQDMLYRKHPGIPPEDWITEARQFAQDQEKHRLAAEQHQLMVRQLEEESTALEQAVANYCAGEELEQTIAHWEHAAKLYQQLSTKQRELQSMELHAQDLQALTVTAPEPEFADELTLSQQETDSQLQACRFEQRQLQMKIGQHLGQIDAIGEESVLRARLDAVLRRIGRLEDHYRALELAQDALYQASNALQRRFAPRISKCAQGLFCRLTGGKYDRLTLGGDLSVQTAAGQEDTMYGSQWRSDGTVDQLYFALRLAVAGEVTPDAPLILDDALVRFDDQRLKTALQILKEEADSKQVILFTCQSRENKFCS